MKGFIINMLGGYTPQQTEAIAIQTAEATLEHHINTQPSIVHGFMHHKYNGK